jgi:hypothetical protein
MRKPSEKEPEERQSLDAPAKSRLYATPEEALKKVSSEFEYWTGRLTETSLQMCYALIAANWLVFGSVRGILGNLCATLSLLMVCWPLPPT